MDRAEIEQIVEKVFERLGTTQVIASVEQKTKSQPLSQKNLEHGSGIFETIDHAVNAAGKAFDEIRASTLEDRSRWIANLRKQLHYNFPNLARMTVEETILPMNGRNLVLILKPIF